LFERMTAAPLASLKALLEKVGGEPSPDFDAFASLFRPRRLRKGECFVRPGECTSSLAFVHSGIARMFYTREDGKEFNKGFVSAPDLMSALEAVLTGAPSALTIQALSSMDLLVADYAKVAEFYERDLFWSRVGRRFMEDTYVRKVRREASFLLQTAGERYEDFRREHRDLAESVPDYHIAAYLGITPEALSRLKRAARDSKRRSRSLT
jgi:CRP-like cAMP-binding protein